MDAGKSAKSPVATRSASTEVVHHVAALSLGLAGAYLMGLGVFWLDTEVFARRILDALPSQAVGTVDLLYGGLLELRPATNCFIF